MKYYFYLSTNYDGYYNLACDEYFLNTLPPNALILYLYTNSNAVIIGKNQNPWKECNIENMRQDDVQLVRRSSGGGAVYHDLGNLNFSFITAKKNYNENLHTDIIINAVERFGIKCEISGRNDILTFGKKFSGNAYLTRANNKQRHGTLLVSSDISKFQKYLNVSSDKLKAKGISSVKSRVCNLCQLSSDISVNNMIESIQESYKNHIKTYEDIVLSDFDKNNITKISKQLSSFEYLYGNTPDFDFSSAARFEWGCAEINFNIKNAFINKAILYTDSLTTEISEWVSNILEGEVYDENIITEKLYKASVSFNCAQLADIAKLINKNKEKIWI